MAGKPSTQPLTTSRKALLLIGAGTAIALANTEVAPLIAALLGAGIVYQIIQITGGNA